MVSQFPEGAGGSLTCTKCEDYSTETERTLALHVALVHDAIQPYLEDSGLLAAKRQRQGLSSSHPGPSKPTGAQQMVFPSQVMNKV